MIGGQPTPLIKWSNSTQVRHIYGREEVVVPADVSINVPVRLPYNNLHHSPAEWLTEAKVLRPGLFLAGTFLTESDDFAAICTVNVSDRDQCLRTGLCMGQAVPGIRVDDPDNSPSQEATGELIEVTGGPVCQ